MKQTPLLQRVLLNKGGIPQKRQFPTLQSIAIMEVAKNFEKYAKLEGIDQSSCAHIRKKIIETSIELAISKDTGIHNVNTTAKNIHLEEYWKRACEYRWRSLYKGKPINIQQHGNSWKVAYLQRHIVQMIERIINFQDYHAKKEVVTTIRTVSSWIFTLHLSKVPQNFDLRIIFDNLPLLRVVHLKYSEGSLNQKRRESVGMKLAEAANLGEAIKNSFNLVELSLCGNQIDDDLFKFLMAGINFNISLLELNLSHNRISDMGAKRIAKYLIRNQILIILNLSNNSIGYDGSRYLSQALKINKNLQELYLKLNKFDDKAGSKFFKDLALNSTLKVLDLSANTLANLTARKIAELLQTGTGLVQILVGNNDFNEQSLQIIRSSMSEMSKRQYFEASKFNQIRL